jgi:hypothetical protein
MLVSRSARSERTTTSRRRPIAVVTIHPAPINSYSFVRPKPVTSHASSIVQVSRWANGIVLGSAAFGADRLICDRCLQVFSRRLYLTRTSYSHKLDRPRVDCATSNVNANIRGRSRTTAHVSGGGFAYFRTPRATRKFFANAPATVRHRAEANLLTSAVNSASARRCSPASQINQRGLFST